MKTQKKQLPNEFTFVCDKHSKSQLEKLGVELDSWSVLIFGYIYLVKNNKVIDYNYGGFNIKYKYAENLTPINLADYIEQEQPENSIKFTNFGTNNDFYTQSTRLEFKTDGNRIPIGQKWQEKTRGGFEYRIYEEFEGKIYGRVKTDVGNWLPIHWYDKGNYSSIEKHNWDLLPYNPLLTTLEKELEEVRLKEKEILEKIEELKK